MPALIHNGTVLVAMLEPAETFVARTVGLMGRRDLPAGTGLLICPCRSIHTSFMRFDLDVIFFNRSGQAIKVVRNLAPWRIAWGGVKATSVAEFKSGWLPGDGVFQLQSLRRPG